MVNQENLLQTHASSSKYWTSGLERVNADSNITLEDVLSDYVRGLVRSFMRGEYRLEDIRKVTQWASMLDGEATRLAKTQELTEQDLSELQARRLAHHSIRGARNVVSSTDSLLVFSIRNNLMTELGAMRRARYY